MTIPMNLDVVRSALKVASRDQSAAPGPATAVVTIARQAGTGAQWISMRVTELLNERHGADQPWLAYGRNLVEEVAKASDLEADVLRDLDEKDQGILDEIFATVTGKATTHSVAMKMSRTIRGLARIGRAVVVGRGGSVVLGGFPNALHVRLVAPLDWRVRGYARHHGIDEADARTRVEELDEQRADYVRATLNRDPADPDLYDLTINVERLTASHTADIIVRAVEELSLVDE